MLVLALGSAAVGCGTADRASPSPAPTIPSAAGAAGSGPETPETVDESPPLSIAGRWGMFHFEDPVAVELIQNGSQLSGLGCDAGLPSPEWDGNEEYCGPISGEVMGNQARFEIAFSSYRIAASVTISADASRMTGDFELFGPSADMAWLRFTDGPWLQERTGQPVVVLYDTELQLIEASPGASEFELGKIYRISQPRNGIWGDLGNFWHSEISQTSLNGPTRVGPVPMTDPERPVSLEIEHQSTLITRVIAVAGSGATYVFEPAR